MPHDRSWLASQIVYEIFPERFAIGKRCHKKLSLPCYSRANDYVTHDWNASPHHSADRGAFFGDKSFFGGDLYGVIDHLDYLQELGVTTLFLTPVFLAPSSHKYDATDFLDIDEQFGGPPALKELIEQLHRRHMYLFMDVAFNHVSDIHPWFVSAVRHELPFRDFFLPGSELLPDEFKAACSPEFSLAEFRAGLSVGDLCAAIEETNCDLAPSPAAKRIDWLKIDWLNTLLRKPDLRDQLSCQMINRFDERQAHNFPEPEKEKHDGKVADDDLRWSNRRLLETMYPRQAPKLEDRFSLARLCEAIESDGYGMTLSSAPKTVEWLNELIGKPELYNSVTTKRDVHTLGEYEQRKLADLREKCDQSGDDTGLKTLRLKTLNRYLLEVFYPDEMPMSYQSWRGYRPMPELNLMDRNLQNLLFRNSDSVLQTYLRMGVDGFRFDAATDVGRRVIRDIRQALNGKFPDAAFIGEVTNYGGGWIDGASGYDGVMNYYFYALTDAWLRGEMPCLQFNWSVKEYCEGYGTGGAARSWNILSSHDTPRLKSRLTNVAMRELAVIAQFTLPGVPFIYYGEEIGMEGGDAPDCRRPMVWDEARWDRSTLELYKKLIKHRTSRAELRQGDFMLLSHKMESDCLAFLRFTAKINEVAIVVLNRSLFPIRGKLFIPYSHLYDGLRLKDLLCPGRSCDVQCGGHINLEVGGRSAVIFVPDDTRYPNYNFYKPRNL